MKSPCTGKCKLENAQCVGCYRTVDEIRNWRSMNEQEKREVCFKICLRASRMQAVRDESIQDDIQD